MRWYKSAWLCAPVALIAFATLPAQTAPAAGADEAKVRAIVNSIYGKMGYKLPVGSRQSPDTAYSPSTDMLSKQYVALSKDEDISSVYNFDHFCECQDDGDPHAARVISVVRVAPDLIDATAEHSEFDQTAKTRLRFQRNGSSWMLHDIFWSEGGSLRSLLTEEIARLTSQKAGTARASAATQSSVAKPTVMPASVTAQPVPQAPTPVIPVQSISQCGDNPRCAEVSTFVATVTDLRESVMNPGSAPLRVVGVTVHFRNKTQNALVLGYVAGSGVVTDDRGNRYTLGSYLGSGVRGMGVLNNGAIDPKFALRGGETGDARFEFLWPSPPSNTIFGTRLVVELAVREIESLAGDQWRLGREYALQFRNFSESGVSAAATAAATPAPISTAASPVDDACAKLPECYSAGPFLAEITRLSTSDGPAREKDIQFSVRFRNLTGQPLVLGHTPQSVSVVDDQGNRYTPRYGITEVRGMGRASGMQSDPSFVLRPGATGEATYQARFGPPSGAVRYGTTYTVEFAVEQLELLPGNQVRSARQFAVGFHDVKTKSGGWRALGGLINIEIKKKSP